MEIGDVVVARATSDAIDGVAIITGGVEFDTQMNTIQESVRFNGCI